MITLHSVQRHTGLTYSLIFFTFGHSGAQSWPPECLNIKKLKGWVILVWRWMLL